MAMVQVKAGTKLHLICKTKGAGKEAKPVDI